jgi:hypothetical protein
MGVAGAIVGRPHGVLLLMLLGYWMLGAFRKLVCCAKLLKSYWGAV